MKAQLTLLLAAIGVPCAVLAETPERVHTFVVQWDLNGDGKISFAEFKQQSAKGPRGAVKPTAKEVRDLFKEYDLDGDGFITEAEMQETNRRAIQEAAASRKK